MRFNEWWCWNEQLGCGMRRRPTLNSEMPGLLVFTPSSLCFSPWNNRADAAVPGCWTKSYLQLLWKLEWFTPPQRDKDFHVSLFFIPFPYTRLFEIVWLPGKFLGVPWGNLVPIYCESTVTEKGRCRNASFTWSTTFTGNYNLVSQRTIMPPCRGSSPSTPVKNALIPRDTLKKRTHAYALNYTCGKDICKLRVKTSQTIHLGCDTKRVWVSSTVQVFFFTPLPFFFSFFFFFVRRRWHQTRSWINEGNNWSGVQMSRSIPKKTEEKL